MIRKPAAIFALLIFLSACASGQYAATTVTFEPARFTITDTEIMTVDSSQADEAFMDLLEIAAENASNAYSNAQGDENVAYHLEFTLEELAVNEVMPSLLPLVTNQIKMTAKLREFPGGPVMREYPVGYQLVRVDPADTKERQLLRGAIPHAMNGIYGLASTPREISELIASDRLFQEGVGADVTRPTAKTFSGEQLKSNVSAPLPNRAPENVGPEDVGNSASDADGPTVIECSIC